MPYLIKREGIEMDKTIEVAVLTNVFNKPYAVQITLDLKRAEFFSDRHENITNCVVEDVKKAVNAALKPLDIADQSSQESK